MERTASLVQDHACIVTQIHYSITLRTHAQLYGTPHQDFLHPSVEILEQIYLFHAKKKTPSARGRSFCFLVEAPCFVEVLYIRTRNSSTSAKSRPHGKSDVAKNAVNLRYQRKERHSVYNVNPFCLRVSLALELYSKFLQYHGYFSQN